MLNAFDERVFGARSHVGNQIMTRPFHGEQLTAAAALEKYGDALIGAWYTPDGSPPYYKIRKLRHGLAGSHEIADSHSAWSCEDSKGILANRTLDGRVIAFVAGPEVLSIANRATATLQPANILRLPVGAAAHALQQHPKEFGRMLVERGCGIQAGDILARPVRWTRSPELQPGGDNDFWLDDLNDDRR